MGLFGPQWKSRNAYKAIDAINMLNREESQEILESTFLYVCVVQFILFPPYN